MSSSEGTPMTWKPSTPANLGSVTNLLTSPKARKKRKLNISGIPPDDERRFEGYRKWCEVSALMPQYCRVRIPNTTGQSFGELNSITRVPNGDLHVDFRKAEVADTVRPLKLRLIAPVLTPESSGLPPECKSLHRWCR